MDHGLMKILFFRLPPKFLVYPGRLTSCFRRLLLERMLRSQSSAGLT